MLSLTISLMLSPWLEGLLNFEHADWENFRHFVSAAVTDSEVRFHTNRVNANWDLFKEILDIGINKYIPKNGINKYIPKNGINKYIPKNGIN